MKVGDTVKARIKNYGTPVFVTGLSGHDKISVNSTPNIIKNGLQYLWKAEYFHSCRMLLLEKDFNKS